MKRLARILLCTACLCVCNSAPASIGEEMATAKSAASSGEWDRAIAIYSEILRKQPENWDAMLSRGRVYGWQGRFDRAEADVRRVTKAKPGYEDAWSALADVLVWAGKFEESAKAAENWIRIAPGNPEAYLARARAFAAKGSRLEAREDLVTARKLGADRFLVARRLEEIGGVVEGFWRFSAGGGYEILSGRTPDWTSWYSALGREAGGIYGEAGLVRAKRYGDWENMLVADLYSKLWRGAYGNLGIGVSPGAEVLARSDLRAELFQSVFAGWEVSGSFRNIRYLDSGADVFNAGAGLYRGPWYLRALGGIARSRGTTSGIASVGARLFLSGEDDYVEAAGGTETESFQGYAGTSPSAARSYFVSCRTRVFPFPAMGFTAGVYASDGPDSVGRMGFTAGTILRW